MTDDDGAYVQFAAPNVPYSAIRVPLVADGTQAAEWIDRALKMAVYLDKKFIEAFPEAQRAPAPQQPRPQQGQRPPQQQYQGGGQMSVIFDGNGDPCCSMHKTREGFPRPMKWFDANGGRPEGFKCTAKKKDGTYCTNAHAGTVAAGAF